MDHTVVHFEIPADDPERAIRFYRELFGWKIDKAPVSGGPEYWSVATVPRDDKGRPSRPGVNGGLLKRQHAEHTPVNYIGVVSVDQHTEKAKRLGAQVMMSKTAVPGMGWFAWLKDPEGNPFAIWQEDSKAA